MREVIDQRTNLEYWRLLVQDGRQTWHYLTDEQSRKDWPQSTYDKYWLGILKDSEILEPARTPLEAARNGLRFFKKLQTEDGHFAGEYGGPMFLIPGFVIVMYITNTPYPSGYKPELVAYLKNTANKQDGGWGIHIEGHSTVFGTALNYVALRLLGVDAEDPVCQKARGLLHKLGGAIGIPSWGKFWLSVLNVYKWQGMNPFPTELWLLPDFIPIHPGKMWVHSRQVYLSMGYIYCSKFQAQETELIKSLREELYVEDYAEINWSDHCNNIAAVDLYCPHTRINDFVFGILSMYEKFPIKWIREKSQQFALDQIRAEDRNTDYADLGPVNKMMNCLIAWIVDGPESYSFKRHLERNLDFLWMANNGMRCNGTNGSQLWDTSFACQAVIESGLAEEPEFHQNLKDALGFLDTCQIRHNMEDYKKYYRQSSKGAWPFSTRDQSYTVSDCTAEGLKTVILLQNKLSYTDELIDESRLRDAVDVLLTMQNSNGGFASYELVRGPSWLEWFNAAEVFGNIMIEYTYPECTTSVILGLSTFRKYYPNYRSQEILETIEKAIHFLFKDQRPDGSWFGSWAICFTYATYFALESLSSVGYYYDNSANVVRACEFLISKQMEDGGWGEKYKACETGVWVNHEKSQVVNTSWAILALLAAKYPHQEPIRRGIKLIMSRQQETGEWLQENIEGVFNKNCMISYPNYKFYFPIWALGRYNNRYKDDGILA